MTAPLISALPTPPSRSNAPDLFSSRADDFLGALPLFRTQANDQANYVNGQAIDALASQNAAAASAIASADSATASQNSENASANSAAQSADSAQLSLNSANASASSAAAALLSEQDAQAAAGSAQASAAIAASYTEEAAIRMTRNLVTENVAIGGGYNGVSAGPVGIAEGVIVTILPNHSWSIV